jgi:hypothetical protein
LGTPGWRSPLLFEGRFSAEQVMVVLGEAVCFIAHVLQQAQGVAVT